MSKKLALRAETIRVLSTAELVGVNGGFTQSQWSMCISNGKGNDCHSNIGDCETAPRRTKPSR